MPFKNRHLNSIIQSNKQYVNWMENEEIKKYVHFKYCNQISILSSCEFKYIKVYDGYM